MVDSKNNDRDKQTDTANKIISVATDLFSKKGFEATRMDIVAERVEVNKATIYYYYESKKELFGAVLLNLLGDISNKFQTGKLKEEKPPCEKLKTRLKFVIEQLDSHPEVANILLRQIINSGEQIPDSAKLMVKQVWNKFAELLNNCRESGKTKNIPVEYLQKMIVGSLLLNTLDSDFFPGEKKLNFKEIDEEFIDFLLAGLTL